MLLIRLIGTETRATLVSLGFTLLAILSAQQSFAQTGYELIDLGTLGGSMSGATGLNDAGAVVGWSETNAGDRHAFLFENDTMIDLGTLPGGSDSVATDINSDGLVVGLSGINQYGPAFPAFTQAFAWQGSGMQSLGALYCQCDFNTRYGSSNAAAVNSRGEIVGSSETVRGSLVKHAFAYLSERTAAEGMLDLSQNPGSWSISHANDISDAGHIAGSLAIDAGRDESPHDEPRLATLWIEGEILERGTLPGDDSSSAMGVNDDGVMVGWSGSFVRNNRSAAMFLGQDVIALGTLAGHSNSMALSINNAGQVVGLSASADLNEVHAFLWQDGAIYDLNEITNTGPGWRLVEATDINDSGEISGIGLYRGQQRAFLLRPSR